MITNEREALAVACAMEERAIEIYQRSLLIIKEKKIQDVLKSLLEDEKEHLQQFRGFEEEYEDQDISFEKKMMLDSYGGTFLFQGGLTQAQRKGAFSSAEAMIDYAIQEEEKAYEKYQEFAALSKNEKVKKMFLTISQEEKMHQKQLKEQQKKIGEEKKERP
ncbi:MAG: hypothetical protein GX786_03585 [Clostridiales bacterium]|nr:hypothetical protein [Clostridiales bacterium]